MPGRGWSSPIVWGERVWIATVVSGGEVEPAKKDFYVLFDFGFSICHDARTGRQI